VTYKAVKYVGLFTAILHFLWSAYQTVIYAVCGIKTNSEILYYSVGIHASTSDCTTIEIIKLSDVAVVAVLV
jgi:hypothetical protein